MAAPKKTKQSKKAAGKYSTSFRFTPEAQQALKELTAYVNSKLSIEVSITKIIELLILDNKDNGDHILKLINKA